MRRVVPDIVNNQQLLELPATATVRSAAHAMRERHVGAVLVTADGHLDGIFTERGRVVGIVSRRDFHGDEKARLDDESEIWKKIG